MNSTQKISVPENMWAVVMVCEVDVLEEADTLRRQLTTMVECIQAANGDVLLIEAGSLLAIWVDKEEESKGLPQRVLNVGLSVQGAVKTSHMGLSCGLVRLFLLGDERVFYYLVGDAVEEAFQASSQGCHLEVVVTNDIWVAIENTDNYKYQTSEDGFVTVYSTQEKIKLNMEIEANRAKELEEFERQFGESIPRYLSAIQECAKTTQQVQILDSVSQMVAVVILFRDLDLNTPDQLHNIVNIVIEKVNQYGGVLKRVLRKTLRVYFGWPGFRHSDDPVRAVLFSREVVKTMKEKQWPVIVGLSSGLCFSGLFGIPTRLQCCVIGMPVLVASKIVHYFDEAEAICCINTFFLTHRSLGDVFQPLEKKMTLRSTFPGIFYSIEIEQHCLNPRILCLGWQKEKDDSLTALTTLEERISELEEDILPLLIIEGKIGSGKTTFLGWLFSKTQPKYQIVVTIGSHEEESYHFVWKMLEEIFKSVGVDSEEKVVEASDAELGTHPLHLLNEKFEMNFDPLTKPFNEKDIIEMVVALVQGCTGEDEPVLICCDDADRCMGSGTWRVMLELMRYHLVVVVVTITEESECILTKQRHLRVYLRTLDEEEVAQLTCSFLHVSAVHKALISFVLKHSMGNPLRLREILMLSALQKNIDLHHYSEIDDDQLHEDFHISGTEDLELVCSVKNVDDLGSVHIPVYLLEVVKDHLAGLKPEEHMLVRKCALLGDSFSLFILELVCPEYTDVELQGRLKTLHQKGVLSVQEEDVSFANIYLRTSVLNSMPRSQKERTHLYLADLLRTPVRCPSCCAGEQERRVSVYKDFGKKFRIPIVDMRLCQCLGLRARVLLQMKHHTEEGGGSDTDMIDILLEAAEIGLQAKDPHLVEKTLNRVSYLLKLHEKDDARTVAFIRLQAQLEYFLGKHQEALKELKQAMEIMNINFPSDIQDGSYKRRRHDGDLGRQESKCLGLGCQLLQRLGDPKSARATGKLHLQVLMTLEHDFCEVARARTALLTATAKIKPGRKREKNCHYLISQLRQDCFQRATTYPLLEIVEVRVLVSSFRNVVVVLFERGDLQQAEELGRKCLHLLKIIRHPRQMVRLLNVLTFVYFYLGRIEKCYDMLSHLQDAFQQSGDSQSEVLYFHSLVRILKRSVYRGSQRDRINICCEYAEQYPDSYPYRTSTDTLFCLSAEMAGWAYDHTMPQVAVKWHQRAQRLQKKVYLNNFWSLSGSLALMEADIARVQQNFSVCSPEEVQLLNNNIQKDLVPVRKAVKDYVPVLQEELEGVRKHLEDVFESKKIAKT